MKNSKVKKIRSEKKLSRQALADRARLPVSVIRNAELGFEIFSSEWKKIASALRVPPSRIIVLQNGGLFHRERG